jgi:UDP-N-acetylmuramoyl-tripeptide--D-alanyl-D-alanine ligase
MLNFPLETLHILLKKHPKVVTDSRKIENGCLFFALKGDNFDGNSFALDALSRGAAYSIIDNTAFAADARCILVENVLTTLQNLATYHRRTIEIPIIAITGSNGKTTTKELVSAVLSSHYKTHFTRGNFNNHIGVPLTLLALPEDAEVAVIEMGANHIGEIEALCRIAEPTHGLITNVGKAHLEGFGSFEGVKQTKSELYRFLLPRRGVVFLNMDELYLSELAVSNRLITYSSKNPNTIFFTEFLGGHSFVEARFRDDYGKTITVSSHLVGDYNFNNIMTAIALGRYFKVPSAKIKAAIEGYIPSNNRSQLVAYGKNTFIMDAYNANPSSMQGALWNFKKMDAKHKIAILGEMRELGAESDAEHQSIFELAKSMEFAHVILVGKEFGEAKGDDTTTLYFETVQDLKKWFDQQHFENMTILVKGSRGIRLELLLDNVVAH